MYTKLVNQHDTDGYDFTYNGFGLLKSSRAFLNRFKGKKRDRKLDSVSRVKLLVTISEEDDEFEDI